MVKNKGKQSHEDGTKSIKYRKSRYKTVIQLNHKP